MGLFHFQFRRTQEMKRADEDSEAKDKELAALRNVHYFLCALVKGRTAEFCLVHCIYNYDA